MTQPIFRLVENSFYLEENFDESFEYSEVKELLKFRKSLKKIFLIMNVRIFMMNWINLKKKILKLYLPYLMTFFQRLLQS